MGRHTRVGVAPSPTAHWRQKGGSEVLYAALAFSLLICAFGVLGVAAPARAVEMARRFSTRHGMYIAGALRLAMGVILYSVAPASRAPDGLRVVGAVVIVAGVVTFFLRPERFVGLLDWWEAKGPALVRLQGAFAIVVGSSLAWLLLP